jgi:hypothetical protein
MRDHETFHAGGPLGHGLQTPTAVIMPCIVTWAGKFLDPYAALHRSRSCPLGGSRAEGLTVLPTTHIVMRITAH